MTLPCHRGEKRQTRKLTHRHVSPEVCILIAFPCSCCIRYSIEQSGCDTLDIWSLCTDFSTYKTRLFPSKSVNIQEKPPDKLKLFNKYTLNYLYFYTYCMLLSVLVLVLLSIYYLYCIFEYICV